MNAPEKSEDLTIAERQALAELRTGASFAEASESTNVPLERLMELWRLYGKQSA